MSSIKRYREHSGHKNCKCESLKLFVNLQQSVYKNLILREFGIQPLNKRLAISANWEAIQENLLHQEITEIKREFAHEEVLAIRNTVMYTGMYCYEKPAQYTDCKDMDTCRICNSILTDPHNRLCIRCGKAKRKQIEVKRRIQKI